MTVAPVVLGIPEIVAFLRSSAWVSVLLNISFPFVEIIFIFKFAIFFTFSEDIVPFWQGLANLRENPCEIEVLFSFEFFSIFVFGSQLIKK